MLTENITMCQSSHLAHFWIQNSNMVYLTLLFLGELLIKKKGNKSLLDWHRLGFPHPELISNLRGNHINMKGQPLLNISHKKFYICEDTFSPPRTPYLFDICVNCIAQALEKDLKTTGISKKTCYRSAISLHLYLYCFILLSNPVANKQKYENDITQLLYE